MRAWQPRRASCRHHQSFPQALRACRARSVREPRKVLEEEFGTHLPPGVTIRVHDSTADCRWGAGPELGVASLLPAL